MGATYVLTTSVMIIIAGASLSEQHTNLLLHKAGFVKHKQTFRYHISQQPGQLLSVWLHMHELSFTVKSFQTFISAIMHGPYLKRPQPPS